jgi:uroporphyrinogen-III synthase
MTQLVISTRPGGESDPLIARLRADGWRVAAIPTVTTVAAPSGGRLDVAARRTERYDWIVLTSRFGVECFGDAAERGGRMSLEGGPHRGWVAVGRATAAALREHCARPIIVPELEVSAAIVALLVDQGRLDGARVLLARADAANADLPLLLRKRGARVDDLIAYRTVVAPPASVEPLTRALADPDLAAIVVASGSAVRGLVALAAASGPEATARIRAVPLVSIGPSTSQAVRDAGLRLGTEAIRPTIDELAAATSAAAAGSTAVPGSVALAVAAAAFDPIPPSVAAIARRPRRRAASGGPSTAGELLP